MTICAAAICKRNADESVLIGISDRMMTSGSEENQTEFESNTHKLYGFHPQNVMSMSAGVTDYAYEIACTTQRELGTGASSVEEVANLYASRHVALRNRRIESNLLVPMNELDSDQMSDVNRQIQEGIWNLGTEALIVGVDSEGPHIYHVHDPGFARFCDKLGFLAIGMGAQHFSTFLMSARYDSTWLLMDALLLMFSAKRQAEMAPNVGRTTEMFIAHGTGRHILRPDDLRIIGQHHDTLAHQTEDLRRDTARAMAAALPPLP
jgi:hypothetical protein